MANQANNFHRVASRFTVICRRLHYPHPIGIFYGDNPLDYSASLIFFEIGLVIVITKMVRFLLKPLRQPRVVSEIIGGIIIGPSVLGGNKNFTKRVFPDNAKFVVRNIGVLGFMFFLFVAGVKTDLTLVRKAGRKHFYTAVIGVLIPMFATGMVGYFLRSSLDRDMARYSGIGALISNLAVTTYPVVFFTLQELNLLSSEMGRMSLYTVMIADVIGIAAILVFEAMKHAEYSYMAALWYVIASIVLGVLTLTVIRRIMVWIVDRTPEGKPVDQIFVVFILLGVMVMGFFTDLFGIAIANGSMWLGLVIPDGPPLGATIVERCETIVMELLMPFSYAMVGLYTDVSAMADYGWSNLGALSAICFTAFISKLITTLVVALYFAIPLRDSLTLGLILNLRGQVELLLFVHWLDKKIVGVQMFSAMVLLTALMTGICGPFISILYDPTRPYMVNKRRTIQHTPPGAELGIVVCIPDKESVASLIKLLEFSHPTENSPFVVHALRLIELVGAANSTFIDHDLQPEEPTNKYPDHETIHKALNFFQEKRHKFVKLRYFTTVTAKRTMYQVVCELAMENKATLIIVPFYEEKLDILAGTELVLHGHALQSLNSNVLAHAPCSVGILVDKGRDHSIIFGQSFRRMVLKFVVLFLGGADAREGITYADRMTKNPDVSIMVIRFLAHNNKGDIDIEKKLDDGVVTWFWVKNEANDRVHYREVVVKDGEETLAAIQRLNDNNNDLWIVGRKQGINPVLLEGLDTWGENPELGTVGDYLSSRDFGGSASVLVLHQQVMRGHV